MAEEPVPNETKRMLAYPSNAVTASTLGGAGIGPIIVWALAAFGGVDVPPEIAASIGAVVGNLFGYFFDGGRKA